jgi:hypothetical protein
MTTKPMPEEDIRDGCTSCGWIGEIGVFVEKDECPECEAEGSILACRNYEIDQDVLSAAYREDAFNEGVEWATARNWFLVILQRIANGLRTVRRVGV